MKEETFEGKSEEEALLKASEELGVNISEMTYDVLENETGLFGLFKKLVRIRVRVADEPAGFVYRKEAQRPANHHRDYTEEKPDSPEPEAAPKKDLPIKGPDAVQALEGVLERMGVGAEVALTEDDTSVSLDITTEEEDVVIGRDGEVLSALQFVVNKMVNRFPESRKRVVLDAVGFRTRRQESLSALAGEMGDKAIETGKVVRLSPMNAHDRRLIHMALKKRSGLSTRSEGDGMFRCLLIVPDGFQERRAGRGGRRGGSRGSHPQRERDPERNA